MRINDIHFNFRIPTILYDRIGTVQDKMTVQNMGIRVERAQVVRLLLEHGLNHVEKNLGIK